MSVGLRKLLHPLGRRELPPAVISLLPVEIWRLLLGSELPSPLCWKKWRREGIDEAKQPIPVSTLEQRTM